MILHLERWPKYSWRVWILRAFFFLSLFPFLEGCGEGYRSCCCCCCRFRLPIGSMALVEQNEYLAVLAFISMETHVLLGTKTSEPAEVKTAGMGSKNSATGLLVITVKGASPTSHIDPWTHGYRRGTHAYTDFCFIASTASCKTESHAFRCL